MALWTISAQPGTPGLAVAAGLAARAGVPLLDRRALAVFAQDLEPGLALDDVEARFCGRLTALALSLATGTGSLDAFHELELRRALPELGRTVMHEVARHPAVVLAAGAFACLQDHPAAIHVRLHAPREWRIDEHARHELVEHARAVRAIDHDDHAQRALVRTLHRLDVDDARLYSLVVDASRFAVDRIVDLLLAAAAVPAAV
jgi:Cytidylate kinase-like family